jgi:TMEM175 potassium channel family protein
VEAFSDGVFAVAITLLIFGVATPHPSTSTSLRTAFANQAASYVTYVVSFLTIGIIWANHHGTFARIRQVNRTLLFLNLALLMTVAFIPFATSLLGTFIEGVSTQRGFADAQIAAALCGATMTLMSPCFLAIWAYAVYTNLFLCATAGRTCRARLCRASASAFSCIWPPSASPSSVP